MIQAEPDLRDVQRTESISPPSPLSMTVATVTQAGASKAAFHPSRSPLYHSFSPALPRAAHIPHPQACD